MTPPTEDATMTSTETPETVECLGCGKAVAPTREGGTRPRDHLTSEGVPCPGPAWEPGACERCHKGPYDPDGCGSPLFHPEEWEWTDPVSGATLLVGNAAAAGLRTRSTGDHYQWLVRRTPEGPRRAPAHIGIRNDGVRFYPLAAVVRYQMNRPGIPRRSPAPAAPAGS